MEKDLRLAVEAASAKGVKLEIGDTAYKMYTTLSKEGMAQKDFSVVYDYLSKK